VALRNQKARFALQLPAKLQAALLPLLEKEDAEAARHFASVYRTVGGDVEVPMIGSHLLILARVAGQHFHDIPQAHNLFNAISIAIA
jgi:hypothetical protein